MPLYGASQNVPLPPGYEYEPGVFGGGPFEAQRYAGADMDALAGIADRASKSKYGTYGDIAKAADIQKQIADEFMTGMYQNLKYSLMSGDFQDFGKTAMQMLQSSLLDALIQQPFQDFANSLVSNLIAAIGGVRLGTGGGTTISNGTGGNLDLPAAN